MVSRMRPVFKGDEKHGIRGRVQPDPAIKKKIPWYQLCKVENHERVFPKLSPVDGGAEFRLREA